MRGVELTPMEERGGVGVEYDEPLFEGAQQSLTDKLDALRNRTSAPAVVDLSERRQQRARGAGS